MSAFSSIAKVTNCVNDQPLVKSSLLRRVARWHLNWRTRRQLACLPGYMLKDIGVSRVDAEQEANKPFWKD